MNTIWGHDSWKEEPNPKPILRETTWEKTKKYIPPEARTFREAAAYVRKFLEYRVPELKSPRAIKIAVMVLEALDVRHRERLSEEYLRARSLGSEDPKIIRAAGKILYEGGHTEE